jgi:hypothetical protein
MHLIFQSFNHMYIYNSLLRSSMISSALRVNHNFDVDVNLHNNFSQSSIDTPTILERFVLTLALILWVLSQGTYFPLVCQSLKSQVPIDNSYYNLKKREVTYTFVENVIYCKELREERHKETQVLLTLKFKITLLCRKWSVSSLNWSTYIVFSIYFKIHTMSGCYLHFPR